MAVATPATGRLPEIRRRRVPAPAPSSFAAVDIVVPVFNEKAVLEASVRRLHDFLCRSFPFSWRIVIADNASTDGTLRLARRLAVELDGVEVLHLDEKGRGRALRAAWSRSTADVACYMDVDLSTDLRALLPLVAPLVSGHSDLAIGSRLTYGARVRRSAKRELISRSYNRLLQLAVHARFRDAQCGFKAGRVEVLRELLPEIRDESWFFDTELLTLAQRRGLRTVELPVDWVEDTDSRVDIVNTALADLRGVGRLLAASPVARFLAVGVLSTLAYALLYLLLRGPLPGGAANAIALAATAVGNTLANRHLTFGLRGSEGLVRQLLLGGLVYVITLALTDGALAVLHDLVARPSVALEVLVLTTASTCATVTRYVALRSWVFARTASASRATPSSICATVTPE